MTKDKQRSTDITYGFKTPSKSEDCDGLNMREEVKPKAKNR